MPTDLGDKNVLRLQILVDDSLVVDAVQCSSKAAPELIGDV